MSVKKSDFLFKLRRSVWTFPVVLFLILCILTLLKISGTSVGVYHEILYGKGSHDSNLIIGHPQALRSDEWIGNTQEVVSQSKTGFHRVNPDMGPGQNISLQPGVPVKDWPTIFKLQNWSYFIMPLAFAFAFSWWWIMYLLIVSCYFFTLRVLKGGKIFAVIFSLAIGLSPFELWWYQADAFLSLAYGFIILILFMRILNDEKIKFVKNNYLTNGLYILSLAFVITSFGLLFYPPFLIPVAVVVLFFALGYLLHRKIEDGLSWTKLSKPLLLILSGAAIAGILGLAFIYSNRSTLDVVGKSLYPGQRKVSSGNMSILQVFDAFVMPVEQNGSRAAHFFTNASEASNFILLLPFLVIPGFGLMIWEWRRDKRIDWIFLMIQLCALVFFVRAFTPLGNIFGKLLVLNRVPNNGRLLIGMGFLGILQIIYIVKKVSEVKIKQKMLWLLALSWGLVCFVVLMLVSLFIRHHFPLFLHNWLIYAGLAGLFTSIIVAFLANLRLLAVSLMLLFTLVSGLGVIPLYRGLGFDENNAVIRAIDNISGPQDTWATVDNLYFQSLGVLAGRDSISGGEAYPNIKFWRQVGGKQYDNIYNREGHVIFVDNPSLTSPFKLVQPDYFQVKFECSNFVEKNINFVATIHKLTYSCTKLEKTVAYPKLTFYLYKVGS